MDTTTFTKIKALNTNAANLEAFHAKVDDLRKDKNNDKLGAGFGRDFRFSAFKVETSFDSFLGTYGNSSCSSILRVQSDLVVPFIVKAMNVHQRAIFKTAADLMRTEASGLTDKAKEEIAALLKMVEDLTEGDPSPVSEAA